VTGARQSEILIAALDLAGFGWHVFPCDPQTKRPKTKHGLKDATTDAALIRQWWSTHPAAMIGVRTGPESGLWAIDLDRDPDKGLDGIAAWADLVNGQELPQTITSRTPRGGLHMLFAWPPNGADIRNSASKIAPGVDCRGRDGYLILPPSRRADGRCYQWNDESAFALHQAPAWLLERVSGQPHAKARSEGNGADHGPDHKRRAYGKAALKAECDRVATAPHGRRNAELHRAACRLGELVAGGVLGVAQARTALEDAARAAGLDQDEIGPTIGSGFAKGFAEPRGPQDGQQQRTNQHQQGARGGPASAFITVNLADVTPQPVSWLWSGRLAVGKVTIIAGDPGLGKSQASIDIAARLSCAAMWPDGGRAPCGRTLLLSAEDSLDDTVRPRAEAAGADLARITALTATVEQGGKRRTFNLQADLDRLAVFMRTLPDVICIVVDPITAYMGMIDSHRTTDVRAVLAPLADFAAAHHVAVLAISHPPKAAPAKAMHAVTGSLAFVAFARMVFIAVEEPDSDRRLLLPVKNNLGALAPGLGFRLAQRTTSGAIVASHVEWDSAPVHMTAGEALAAADDAAKDAGALHEAKAFLVTELADGARLVAELQALAEKLGISQRTLERAKKLLGIRSERHGGLAHSGGWEWSLPA
jgi:Bifunctional DNA primase/polymerase, N-terminal/AAA domain